MFREGLIIDKDPAPYRDGAEFQPGWFSGGNFDNGLVDRASPLPSIRRQRIESTRYRNFLEFERLEGAEGITVNIAQKTKIPQAIK